MYTLIVRIQINLLKVTKKRITKVGFSKFSLEFSEPSILLGVNMTGGGGGQYHRNIHLLKTCITLIFKTLFLLSNLSSSGTQKKNQPYYLIDLQMV